MHNVSHGHKSFSFIPKMIYSRKFAYHVHEVSTSLQTEIYHRKDEKKRSQWGSSGGGGGLQGLRDGGGIGKKSSCVAFSPWTDLLHIDIYTPRGSRSYCKPVSPHSYVNE